MIISNNWWLLLLKGLALILFGFLAMAWPAVTLVTLAYLFALFVLISGIINIIQGLGESSTRTYWFLRLLLGIFEIGVGAYALANLSITLTAFLVLLGITFAIRGILEVIIAFEREYAGAARILLIIAGGLGILAGLFILRNPIVGGLAFAWILGVYAIVAGAIMVALAVAEHEATVGGSVRQAKR